ncbi:MAG: membrane protein insertase YidC [Clostridia bacterium]|nr:membrane protein insertase YidC [Clostridia bacterium]
MDVINLIGCFSQLNDAIGRLIYDVLFGWIQGWSSNWGLVGAFSVTVIMFTIFLKTIVMPFDVWQKQLTRSNAKKMEKMKPELEKITKQCGSNRELLMQKQRALYKKYKYSTFGACLPMIITLAIFFIVFGGFNSAVRMHNEKIYNDLEQIYDTAYNTTIESPEYASLTTAEKKAAATKKAEAAVKESYKSESFFWTKNIFVPDNWRNPIPSSSEFTGSGWGKSGVTGVDAGKYDIVMSALRSEYDGQWNGYLILPILVLLLNVASMFLNKQPQQPAVAGQSEEQAKAQQTQMKVMQFIMPIMMLVFALFYSAAFTLYMFVNSFITTAFNLIFNIVTKRIDAKEKDQILSSTIKK